MEQPFEKRKDRRARKTLATVFAWVGVLFLLPKIAYYLFFPCDRVFCFHGLFAGNLFPWLARIGFLFLFAAFVLGVIPALRHRFFRGIAVGVALIVALIVFAFTEFQLWVIEREFVEFQSDDGAHTVVIVCERTLRTTVVVYERENAFTLCRLQEKENRYLESFSTEESFYHIQWENNGFYLTDHYFDETYTLYFRYANAQKPSPAETGQVVTEDTTAP